jgi:hypothetical protein
MILMPLFGPPDIEKLTEKKNIRGLITALGYENDSNIREAAAQALINICKSSLQLKSNSDTTTKILEKIADSKNPLVNGAFDRIFNALYPQFSEGPKSRLRQELEDSGNL